MRYAIDSYAWLEYFMGTERGERARAIIDSPVHEKLTPSICLAEVYAKSLRLEGEAGTEKRRTFMKSNSAFIALNEGIAVQAAKLDVSLKESVKGWGLADSIVLATARSTDSTVVTGDKHFEGLEDVELI
ncbi:MAG: type II toxin-antitoxin system VapC family toxin [Thaumarchaeota archaeon]|nr:type II toxin-antitoxin system VapC family toxin [Nitrososphaerota archaeon]